MSKPGRDAEDRACRFLERQGLRTILRNFRGRQGELDLVMLDGATLVVAEVRARSHAAFGGALESIDRHKQRKIIQTSLLLLAQRRDLADRPVRFDVIGFDGEGKLQWIRDAFQASDL